MNQSSNAAPPSRVALDVVERIADDPHVQNVPGAFPWEELVRDERRWIRAIVEVALAQFAPDATHSRAVTADTGSGGLWKASAQSGFAALRMVREAVEAFGPATSLESPEAVLLRGPEPTHEAEAIIEALGRLRHATPAQPVSVAGSEPVAWRWRFDDQDRTWRLMKSEPPQSLDTIVQPLALHSDYMAEKARAGRAEAELASLRATPAPALAPQDGLRAAAQAVACVDPIGCRAPCHDDDGVRYCDICGRFEGCRIPGKTHSMLAAANARNVPSEPNVQGGARPQDHFANGFDLGVGYAADRRGGEHPALLGLRRANALVPGGDRYIADEIARLEGREA